MSEAGKHRQAILDAIYKLKDGEALVSTAAAAEAYIKAIKKIAKSLPRTSSYIDAAGNYDHDMYELAQLMVDVRKRLKRIKKLPKAGKW